MFNWFKKLFPEVRLISVKHIMNDMFEITIDDGNQTIIQSKVVLYKGYFSTQASATDSIIYAENGKSVPPSVKKVIKSCRNQLNYGNPGQKIVFLTREFASIEAKLNKLGL